MSEAEVFEILRAALWAAVLMGAPILGVTLVLGFVIGLVQALTSIQEMTLTFIPKIIAVVVVLFLTLGYMTKICLDLFFNSVLPIIAGNA
ncbi:MAG: flagellar biosynthetic protein FliQ [Hyphomonadaceae bacterium]